MPTKCSYRFIEDLEQWTIERKYIRKDRWFVQISLNGRTKTVPHANFLWLKYNPSFKAIPENYVIHHLDNDPLNDDLSNLALMARPHHSAYHLKRKIAVVPIYLDETMGFPINRPRIYYHKGRKRYYICYRIKTEEGIKTKHITHIDKRHFETREEAIKAVKEIWPFIEFEWKIN